jgi:signal transduction histidine kinase/ligand-binding sensor domain-containing protein
MSRRNAFVAVLFGAALFATPAFALDPGKTLSQCTVDVWQLRDGLPGTWVREITQTPDGYLWVNTFGGVARFDGARFVRLEGPPRAVRNTFDVGDLMVARDGTMWMAPAYSEPLCVHDDKLDICIPNGFRVPTGDRVTSISEVAAGDLWIATRQRVFHVTGAKTAGEDLSGITFQRIVALHHDRQGRVWLATFSGLFVREPDGRGFRRFRAPEGPVTSYVSALFERPGGGLWVGTSNAIYLIDGDRTVTIPRSDSFPFTRPTAILEDRDGNLWVGTGEGLYRVRDGQAVAFRTSDGLPDDDVSALFEDREGSLWVGTRNGGIAQFTDRTVITQAGPPALRDSPVESLCQDPGGAIWFATVREGAVRWKDGQTTAYTSEQGMPSSHATAVTPGAGGVVWIGTNRGLARWRDGRIDTDVPVTLPIASLYVDPGGVLWVGADNGSIVRVANDKPEPIPVPAQIRLGQVRSMVQDREGRLWIAGATMLGRRDGTKVVQISPGPSVIRQARSIYQDAAGVLWFGTNGTGLVRYAQGRFRSFSSAEGIFDQLYQVVGDDEGYLWMGTSRGILRVSQQALADVEAGRRQRVDLVSFERSDQRRDVAATRIHQPSAWKTTDGRVWFATDKGLITIDPRRLRSNPVKPSVLVQEAIIDGQVVRRGERNALPPGPGNLEFHFAAITLLEPQKAAHRYLLEGFDERWVDAGTRRVAYYTNLPAGHYRFRVQASNADGLWNEAGDALEFYLRPHFYRTPWFYALCVAGVLSLGFWFHRSRLARVRAESLATAAERTRVARELHDTLLQEMSAVSLQIGAIRAGLPAASPTAEKLRAIESIVTGSLAETRRYVWDLREPVEKGDSELAQALSALAASLTEARQPPAASCKVLVEGKPGAVSAEAVDQLLRIAGEALRNALQHAEARYIELRLCYERHTVRLSISDDGRGFDVAGSARAGHFGLVGMRERAERLGGKLTVNSRPGQGSTVEVVLPRAETEPDAPTAEPQRKPA